MAFDELVNAQIKHVVLDSQVAALSVDLKLLFVVNDDHLSREIASQVVQRGLERSLCVYNHHSDFALVLGK